MLDLRTLSDKQKEEYSEEIQKQVKSRLMDTDLRLTDIGQDALMDILANEYEEELSEKADELIKQRKGQ